MDRVAAQSLGQLRTRTSEKWTAYPSDVLPLFVAESDFPLAEPVASALHAAIDRSDTGYIGNDGGAAARAFAGVREGALGLAGRSGAGAHDH